MRIHLRSTVNLMLMVILVALCLILFNSQEKSAPQMLDRIQIREFPRVNNLQCNITTTTNNETEKTTVPVHKNTEVKLVLLTYMRSGSSFAGDVFNHHPEVFYVYEPLWSIQKHYFSGEPIFFFNKGPIYPDKRNFFSPWGMSVNITKSLLNCNFRDVDPRTLTQYHLTNSVTTKNYFRCTKLHPGISGIQECLPLIQNPCYSARVTSLKTIRFSMKQAAVLLKDDPQVKIIHLVRDPRATLRSQTTVGEFKRWEVGNFSREFCQRVLEDLKEAEQLKTLYPGRVFTVRYEDLAMEPIESAETLLSTVGLKMDLSLRQYIWNITSAGLKDGCTICSQRNDSRVTSSSWRWKYEFSSTSVIDVNCKDVYERTGYLLLRTAADLKNLSVPAYVNKMKVPGLWTGYVQMGH